MNLENRRGLTSLEKGILLAVALLIIVSYAKPGQLFAISGIADNGRNFGDKNLVTVFDKANIVQGDLFTIKIEEKWLTAREPGFCLPGGGGDSLSKGYAVLDEAKVITPQASCGALPGPFLSLTIDSSKILPGEHIIDVFSTYQYGPNNNGVRFGVESFAVNPTRYATNDYWVGAAKMFVQPAPCSLDSSTEVLVSQVFTAGSTVSLGKMKYPVVKFCDSNPGRILRSDTGGITQDYGLYYNLPYLVPPGFIVEASYVAKKVDVGIQFVCSPGQFYNVNQSKCLVTALVRPCGDNAVLQTDGTCIEFPKTVCSAGSYYNASISEDKCVIDRCPAGSQWYDSLNSCALQIPYSELCIPNVYLTQNSSCVDINDQTKKVAPTYQCPSGSKIVKDANNIYYCQYGLDSYRVCPAGSDPQEGNCVVRETINVTTVIIQKEIVERQIEVPVVVEKEGKTIIIPAKQGLGSSYIGAFVIIIVVAGAIFLFRGRR